MEITEERSYGITMVTSIVNYIKFIFINNPCKLF